MPAYGTVRRSCVALVSPQSVDISRCLTCPCIAVTHKEYMQRALDLALPFRGFVSPNPCVGAVVVKDGRIVAEGAHRKAGAPHAEADALEKAGMDAYGATLYCTLEPCNHLGRTPPCTEAIIASGISEVVIASQDPNPHVAGKGAERLRCSGVSVVEGVLRDEADYMVREFLHVCRSGRPWVVSKTASSLDGKVATATGESKWITSPSARQHGHRLRHEVDAVVVGAGTVMADDPQLSVRLDGGPWSQPVRIVMDSTGRCLPEARVFDPSDAAPPILATTEVFSASSRAAFEQRGVRVVSVEATTKGRIHPGALLEALMKLGIHSLLIEGGPTITGSFLEHDLIDEVVAYLSPSIIGGDGARGAIGGTGRSGLDQRLWLDKVSVERCGADIVVSGLTKRNSNP